MAILVAVAAHAVFEFETSALIHILLLHDVDVDDVDVDLLAWQSSFRGGRVAFAPRSLRLYQILDVLCGTSAVYN